MAILKQAGNYFQSKVRSLTDAHARKWEKIFRQHELLALSDHYLEVRFLRQRAKEADKDTANSENRLGTAFHRSTCLDQLVRLRPAAFDQVLEGSFQDSYGNLSNSLIGQ